VSLAILTRKNRLRPSRTPCSACFIRSRSGIANSFKNKRPRSRDADLATMRCDYGDFTVCLIHNFRGLSRLASEPWLQPGAPPPILANTKPIVYAIIG
jgi:hypothetical protein